MICAKTATTAMTMTQRVLTAALMPEAVGVSVASVKTNVPAGPTTVTTRWSAKIAAYARRFSGRGICGLKLMDDGYSLECGKCEVCMMKEAEGQ